MVVMIDMPHIGRVGTLMDHIEHASDRLNDIVGRWDALDEYAPDMTPLFDRIDVLEARWDRVEEHYQALIRDSNLTPIEDAIACRAYLEATKPEAVDPDDKPIMGGEWPVLP